MSDTAAPARRSLVVTGSQLALVLGVTGGRITQLNREGMPRLKEGYPLIACVQWYLEYFRKRALPSPINSARLRKAEAQADAAEMNLAQKRKGLIEVGLATRLHNQRVERIRRRCLAIAPAVAPAAHRAKTVREVEAVLRAEIYAALEELSRGVGPAAP
jgi:phage terminase Nu1 subunit (DNA packaging protein)